MGVTVVDVHGGDRNEGIYLDTDGPAPPVVAQDDIPLGHKLALVDLEDGAEVIEYQQRIGLARRRIRQGEHVHVHNLRSARW